MQTFLPYPCFLKSARVLDWRRLGKQRLEASQIYALVTGEKSNSWIHHPAVIMWLGHPNALAIYHNCMISEWKRRGYRNTMPRLPFLSSDTRRMPKWLGNREFHASHQSALVYKNPQHYSPIFPKVPVPVSWEGYWWPSKNGF